MWVFRTDLTGAAVFGLTAYFAVIRVGPYQGAIVEALGLWPPGGIPTVVVHPDTAAYLDALP